MPTNYAGNASNYPANIPVPADGDYRNATIFGAAVEALADRTANLDADRDIDFSTVTLTGTTGTADATSRINFIRCAQSGTNSMNLAVSIASSCPENALILISNERTGAVEVQWSSGAAVNTLQPGHLGIYRRAATNSFVAILTGRTNGAAVEDRSIPRTEVVSGVLNHVSPSARWTTSLCSSLPNDATWTIDGGEEGDIVRFINGSVFNLTIQRHGGGAVLGTIANEGYLDVQRIDVDGGWVGIGKGSVV